MALGTVDALAHLDLVHVEELEAQVERLRGRRNIDRARRLIGWCEPLTESFGESWTRLRILDAGFPRPQAQIWVADSDGVLAARLDLGYREKLIGIEYDGEEFHSTLEQRRHDESRRAGLKSGAGWEVLVRRARRGSRDITGPRTRGRGTAVDGTADPAPPLVGRTSIRPAGRVPVPGVKSSSTGGARVHDHERVARRVGDGP